MGAAEAVAFARAQLGKPYVFGATGPNSYDCSGLVQAACKAGGVSITRTTYTQIADGVAADPSALAVGDLVFPDIGHVKLYIGNGQVIHAPHSGTVVQVASVGKVWKARRVFSGATEGTTGDPAVVTPTGLTDPATAVTNALSNLPIVKVLESIAEKLSDPGFWRRLGIGGLGVLLLFVAASFIRRMNAR